MKNKTIYWIPVVGIFAALISYEKEVEMPGVWPYYQALALMVFITSMAMRVFM